MKHIGLFALLFLCLCLCIPGGQRQAEEEIKVLMEDSTAKWTKTVEKVCYLKDLGRPLGTAKEEYKEKDETHEVRFSIDEEMTQHLIDGYALAVWESCVTANDARPHNSSGSIYEGMKAACRRQEPLSYYIWYYYAKQKEFRVGIYPTMMEEGEPGGLVLRIERWK